MTVESTLLNVDFGGLSLSRGCDIFIDSSIIESISGRSSRSVKSESDELSIFEWMGSIGSESLSSVRFVKPFFEESFVGRAQKADQARLEIAATGVAFDVQLRVKGQLLAETRLELGDIDRGHEQ